MSSEESGFAFPSESRQRSRMGALSALNGFCRFTTSPLLGIVFWFQKPAKQDFMDNSSSCGSPEQGNHLDQFVSAEQLLKILWDECSRPSLRWLREQQARRTIPFVKIGARVWFQPSAVKGHLQEKWQVKRY